MANSFFIMEADKERIRYWEVVRGRSPKVIGSGALTYDKEAISELSKGKEVYLFFAPPLVSSITLELSHIKEELFLKHLLMYKDKYFPIPSGRLLVRYFKTYEGKYMVFAIDETLWEKLLDLFPDKKKLIGPLYWAHLPSLLKPDKIFKRDYKGLSEIIGFKAKRPTIFKKGPKGQILTFIEEKNLIGKTLELGEDEPFSPFLALMRRKRLAPLLFEKIVIKEKNIGIFLTFILIVLVFVLFVGGTLKEKRLLEFKIEKIDTMLKEVKKEAEVVQKEKAKIEELTEIIKSYNEIAALDSHPLELLRALSRVLPKDARIEYIELEGEIIKDLEGKSQNATRLLLSLQKEKAFSSLRLKGAVTKEEGMDRFAIEGRFVKNEIKTK